MKIYSNSKLAEIKAICGLFVLAILCVSLAAGAAPWQGSGTADEPYLIADANDMQALGADPNYYSAHFKLTADIDLGQFTGDSFSVVGYYKTSSDEKAFTGVFDGNGHVLRNLIYTSTESSRVGIFGYIVYPAEIRDTTVEDVNIEAAGASDVGGLVGYNYSGTVTNCHVTGSVAGNWDVGGLVGYNGGTVSNCSASVSVLGNGSVGGLVGENSEGIFASYADGSVTGENDVGGLVGYNWEVVAEIECSYAAGSVLGKVAVGGLVGTNEGDILDCYATGVVAGEHTVGGLVGRLVRVIIDREFGRVANCYAAGLVSGEDEVGGLVGRNLYGTIEDACWDIETTGQSTSHWGGKGLTTTQMWTANTFLGWNECGEEIWKIDQGKDYPRLWWEDKPGEAIRALCDFFGGKGTEQEPYLVYTAEQLAAIGSLLSEWDSHFKLMADIDLSGFTGTDFNIIGRYYAIYYPINDLDNLPFTGTFDGNGYAISNLTLDYPDANGIGLFAYLGKDGEIKDLSLADVNINGRDCVGGLAAYSQGVISSCHVGGVVKGYVSVGGLLGDAECSTILNCSTEASVTGAISVGGLLGHSAQCTVSNCGATGQVAGTGGSVGGLIGHELGSAVSKCYATGSVVGQQQIGGLVGSTDGMSWFCGSGRDYIISGVSNCYATGSVVGDRQVGGLTGLSRDDIKACYAKGTVTGNDAVGGLVGENYGSITESYATGLVTAENRAGGLVGANNPYCWWPSPSGPDCYLGISNSFWDKETSGMTRMCGHSVILDCNDANGKTTGQMKTMSTFMQAGWDFVGERINGTDDIWKMTCEGMSYPKLTWWQPIEGDFACPDGVDFVDFALLAKQWRQTLCGQCGGADLTGDGNVRFDDLASFIENWLRGD